MGLGYPYLYGDNLTPEMARLNRLNLFLFLTAFLFLAPKPAQAQFAQGFGNANPPRRQICRNYGIFSRQVTSSNSQLQDSVNNGSQDNKMSLSEYIKDFDVILGNKQLQKKFKHAKAFGVLGSFNNKNLKLFKESIISHMKNPSTEFIQGSWKGAPVNHYFNPNNDLNVMFNPETKRFISGWELTPDQSKNIKERGSL